MNLWSVLIATSLVFGAAVLSAAPKAQTGLAPESHMMLANPANMSDDRADAVYLAIRQNMRAHYLASGDPVTGAYQSWRRYNIVPYRSAHNVVPPSRWAHARLMAVYWQVLLPAPINDWQVVSSGTVVLFPAPACNPPDDAPY